MERYLMNLVDTFNIIGAKRVQTIYVHEETIIDLSKVNGAFYSNDGTVVTLKVNQYTLSFQSN